MTFTNRNYDEDDNNDVVVDDVDYVMIVIR